jgi:hypothetical protein
MRSIPQAMIWELWRRGKWHILAGVLGANVLPVLLFTVLRHDGAVDQRDASQLVMQMILLQMNVFIFAAAMFSAQGSLSSLYALPVTTTTLVTWRLLPMSLAVGLESAASSAALNAVFGLDWPIWGPALFGAASVAAVAAALWFTENSGWLFPGFVLVSGSLGLWHKARYGDVLSKPTYMWQGVTFPEVLTMLAVAVFAYCVAGVGVARLRRGERLPSLGIIAWLDRLLDPVPYAGLPFQSAAQAQSWFEWRKKGLAMPAMVVFGLTFAITLWLIVNRDVHELLHGLLVGGGMLSVAALIGGMIIGNCGPDDANYEMGTFLASRPMITIDMARIILSAAAKSVVLAWLLWAAAFLAVYLILLATQGQPPTLPREINGWYFPAVLIGAWAVTGVLTTAGLAGRSRLFLIVFCGLVASYIGLSLFAKLALAREAREQFLQGTLAVSAMLAILMTVWAFAAARRRKLIGWPTVFAAGSLWAALAALLLIADIWHVWQRPALFIALSGICALAFAPLAAAPLALVWNRNR